jgi:hypothetical protein
MYTEIKIKGIKSGLGAGHVFVHSLTSTVPEASCSRISEMQEENVVVQRHHA